MKKILTLLLAVIMTFSVGIMTGCGESRDKNSLVIKYYVGGFGSEWLESAKSKFIEQNPDVNITLIPESKLRENAAVYLKSGKDLPDIMMSQSLNWADFVTRGYLEPLDDIFESEVKTGVKFKDYLVEDFKEYPYMKRMPNQGSERPWVIPWSILNCGIIYNENILAETTHTTAKANAWNVGDKWTAPPETVDDLMAYITDINAKSGGVIPFSWGGQALNWLLFPMYSWWAQLQGTKVSNIEGEGSWYDFWDFGAPDYNNADVYKQTGIWQAMDILRELIVDTNTKDWKNSPDKVSGRDSIDAEKLFVSGKAAMIFCGSWLENEMRDFLPEGFKMKMMPIPVADGAQVNPETNKPYMVNNAMAGDVMFVPAQAPNKELAKKFLKFISSEDMMMEFTRKTKMQRPYQYDPLALDPNYAWGDFAKSVFDIYQSSDFNLFEYSKKKSYIYTYKRPELFQEMTMATALGNLKRMNGKTIMIDGTANEKSVYQLVSIEYPKWKEEVGI